MMNADMDTRNTSNFVDDDGPTCDDLRRQLDAANERIKRMEEAGDRLFWMAPPGLKDSRVVNAKAAWTKAKEAKA